MSLDEKIRNGRLNRRDFLELGIKGGLALGSAAILNNCGKHDNPITPPGPVTLQFEVYNHTQGYRTSFARNTMSEQNVNIKISDLGYNDVDPYRIVVREKNMGPLANFSKTGEANFTAPRQNMNYDVILFNASNNAPYQWMDDQNSKLYKGKRNYTVYRKDFDGQTGPEHVWESVFYQLNAALNLGWVKLGSINRQPSGTSGDFSYGYGDSGGASGMSAGGFITVNANCNKDNIRNAWVIIGLEEAFENICRVDDIGGHPTAGTIEDDDGVFNPVGKDLFDYIFAREDAVQGSGSSFSFSLGFK